MRLPDGSVERFEVDPFRKECLLAGIDEIELTLRYATDIEAYEARQREETPWLQLPEKERAVSVPPMVPVVRYHTELPASSYM